jgi:acrylyl-CoA reductase (NADPH)
MFNAIYLVKDADNVTRAGLRQLDDSALPQFPSGGVTVDIEYSSINYKDGLAVTGRSPVVRKFPMVPGIDFCGTVSDSDHPDWRRGDQVVLNGWGVGESHWGGLSQRARVLGDWLVRLPENLSSFDAMAVGTAGYTAMLCVMALEKQGVTPKSGEILVTGASGGVGSFAISLLAALGYRVVASSGKHAEAGFLQQLGAAEVIDRATLSGPGKPLQKERWAAAVDTVGSHTLANACATTRYGGVVTACGLAQGMDFPASVAPFILRGVQLIGVDSVMAPKELRNEAWSRLGKHLQRQAVTAIAQTVGLADALAAAETILSGQLRGRIVVNVNC